MPCSPDVWCESVDVDEYIALAEAMRTLTALCTASGAWRTRPRSAAALPAPEVVTASQTNPNSQDLGHVVAIGSTTRLQPLADAASQSDSTVKSGRRQHAAHRRSSIGGAGRQYGGADGFTPAPATDVAPRSSAVTLPRLATRRHSIATEAPSGRQSVRLLPLPEDQVASFDTAPVRATSEYADHGARLTRPLAPSRQPIERDDASTATGSRRGGLLEPIAVKRGTSSRIGAAAVVPEGNDSARYSLNRGQSSTRSGRTLPTSSARTTVTGSSQSVRTDDPWCNSSVTSSEAAHGEWDGRRWTHAWHEHPIDAAFSYVSEPYFDREESYRMWRARDVRERLVSAVRLITAMRNKTRPSASSGGGHDPGETVFGE